MSWRRMRSGLIVPAGGAGEALNATGVGYQTKAYSGASITFSGVSAGDAHPDRWLAICFTCEVSTGSVTGVTVNGVAATLINTGSDPSPAPDTLAGMWVIHDTVSTVVDIVVTFAASESGDATVSVIRLGGITNINDDTYGDVNSSQVALDVATGGLGLCVVAANSSGHSAVNCTQIYSIATGGDTHFVGLYSGASGSVTFGCNATASNCYGVGLAFS